MPRESLYRLIQDVVRSVLAFYLRVYHRLEITWPSAIPPAPILGLTSHFSMLDTVACLVADPYRPPSAPVVKAELMSVPLIGYLLRVWGAIPVAREGHDISALRRINEFLRAGRSIGIAAEGARSRTGRLGPVNPVLVRLAIDVAERGIPIVPAVQIGTFEAMPPGAWFPKPFKIRLVTGEPLDFSPWCGRRLTRNDLSEAAAYIQSAIAVMLPPERRPAPDTPPMSGAPPASHAPVGNPVP